MNQNAVLENGAIPELVDIVDQHSKDYLASPKENVEKGQALLACIGCIHALVNKNRKISSRMLHLILQQPHAGMLVWRTEPLSR
jgi:hypothetical protein